jgi:hypothetical protein
MDQKNNDSEQGTTGPVVDSIQALREAMNRIEQEHGNTDAFKTFMDELNAKGHLQGKKAKTRKNSSADKQFKHYVNKLEVSPTFMATDSNLVKYFLMRALQRTGAEIVLSEFGYKNCIMDVLSVASGRAIEFEIKATRADYFADFDKKMFTGVPVNKHGLIAGGGTMVTKFFFVVPANMVDIRECPQHAGLIWYDMYGDVPVFRVVKPAPRLNKDYLSPGTWQLIARKLMLRSNSLMDRYVNNRFKAIETNSDYAYSNAYDKATDQR